MSGEDGSQQSTAVSLLPRCEITEPEKENEQNGSASNQDANLHSQGNSILLGLKKRMRRFLGVPTEGSTLHKSMQNLTVASATFAEKKSSSTGSDLQNLASKTGPKGILTRDVPEDVQPIKQQYEQALIALTSLTDAEISAVRASWLILKAHIEKIGVIVFLG